MKASEAREITNAAIAAHVPEPIRLYVRALLHCIKQVASEGGRRVSPWECIAHTTLPPIKHGGKEAIRQWFFERGYRTPRGGDGEYFTW